MPPESCQAKVSNVSFNAPEKRQLYEAFGFLVVGNSFRFYRGDYLASLQKASSAAAEASDAL
ncbi:MAG: hypothetical protein AAF992_11845 [Bacteroidota bacterium]